MRSTTREGLSADHHLTWRAVQVEGRWTNYGVAGQGPPVLFLHGWALGQHAYKRALKRLVGQGCQVWAPSMPGFGGSEELPTACFDIAGYARWAAGFVEAVGIDEPVFAIGHSFGGAVATKLAHDFPGLVGQLVLVNSVGGATWVRAGTKVKSMAERPLWHWGLSFPGDLLELRNLASLVSAFVEDALPNAVTNPLVLYRAGQLARRADLTAELQGLRDRGLPVVVLWGDKDTVVPRASFEALCSAVGAAGTVVPGRHSWLLADPDAFGEVMRNTLSVSLAARGLAAIEEVAGGGDGRPAVSRPARDRVPRPKSMLPTG